MANEPLPRRLVTMYAPTLRLVVEAEVGVEEEEGVEVGDGRVEVGEGGMLVRVTSRCEG